jgi:6-pyruvoyltetrahydropterin/6-carboxytetrahydropterin synthase
VQIRKQFRFEAAHVLPHHSGKCSKLHGHSYRVDVAVEGPLQSDGPARGMVVDFDDLAAVVRPSEHIALWIWDELAPKLPGLSEIVVWETQTACAVVRATR